MDEAEFDRWYDASYPRLVAQLTALIGNRAEAQDCVQDAFVRAWDRRLDLESWAARDAWVRTTAHRLAVSRWRRWRRGQALGAQAADTQARLRDATGTDASDIRADLLAAIATLPMPQREAIVLHYLADRSIAQIADELRVAEGTVKARLHRARAALNAQLNDTTGATP